jgi:hypothetical protein
MFMQQFAALQQLLAGGGVQVAPAPAQPPVAARGEEEPVEPPVAEEQPAEQVDDAEEQPEEDDVKEDEQPVEDAGEEVADDETEGSESSSMEVPVEIHDVSEKQMILMYKFYRDIFDNFNWMKKFKDDGKLILTPNQLVAFLSLVCDIDRSAIRIQCDVKPKKRYSDGKIYKVVKIGIETEKELPDLEKVFRSYNVSAEYINYSEKLMSAEY